MKMRISEPFFNIIMTGIPVLLIGQAIRDILKTDGYSIADVSTCRSSFMDIEWRLRMWRRI